jgi:hypothetical protein
VLLFLPILLLTIAFAGGFALRQSLRRPVTEPSCGQCGYCVRGLESMTCPECGSDLRVVGIVTPGVTRPLGKKMRLLGWTLFTPLITMLIGGVLMPLVGPQWLSTARRRVIFSQEPFCNVTLTVNAVGKKLTFGNSSQNTAPAPIELIFVTLSQGNASMQVTLPARQFQFVDANNKLVTGAFDAAAMEKWLNTSGFTAPLVSESAKGIVAAIDEITTPAGNAFTQLPPIGGRGRASGIAHPTFTTSTTQANELTYVAWGLLFVFIWLVGLPIVLRRRPSQAADVTVPVSSAPPATT